MNTKVELQDDPLSFLAKKKPLSEKVQFIYKALKERSLGVDRISVVLYDSKSDLLKTFLYSSDEVNPLIQYQAKLSKIKSLKDIVDSGQARVVNDLSIYDGSGSEHTKKIIAQGFLSSYTHPIFLNGSFLGFVFFNSYQKQFFQNQILQEVNFFGHLISSLVSIELSTTRMMLATIQAAKQISTHHHLETGMHIDRVSFYARLIAQVLAPKYGFTDEFIEHIFLFAPLHDIGKIGVPNEVLNKPDKLDPNELNKMKEHVVIGRQIVDSIVRDFGLETIQQMTTLRNIAEFHHETLDGSGYCIGLQGDEIPIEARIISVADIFDALTSARGYKTAWSNKEAFSMLHQLAGLKLDKDCVEALVQNPQKIKEIQDGFKESPSKVKVGHRKFPRVNIEIKGEFRILYPENNEGIEKVFAIKARAIGRGGMMMFSPINVGEKTPLQVRLFPFSQTITLNAKVAWTKPVGAKDSLGFKIGLEFDSKFQASLLLIDFLLQAPIP
jgi:HD-GYP domain-containing protein (c-di-GMP phosphodiesterase class II)